MREAPRRRGRPADRSNLVERDWIFRQQRTRARPDSLFQQRLCNDEARPIPRMRPAPAFAWHIFRAMPGRDAGRFEWRTSAQHGQAPDFSSASRPARDGARNGLVRFRQSCAIGKPFWCHYVHASVSTLQAYCSLENQTFRGNLYVDAKTCPIPVKISHYLGIGWISATITRSRDTQPCTPERRMGIRASPARSGTLWQNRRHLLRMRITAPLPLEGHR
ncbi:hypothetical protein BamIOP4010DRAFT_6719 [Burkholderia ambifaria IOP40-10]|uniref:Uncharacterized protein n=1 Tax=Burkholderia ambifaria IOP40-10 TaxID=396596 RepID=B1FRQ6_9BURK|nr:hypothetical protein BamIOP4010DRAFT_6719 [Burkholderia ambifaria IOP40-10]